MFRKLYPLFGLLIASAMLLTACGGAATEAPAAVATEAPPQWPPRHQLQWSRRQWPVRSRSSRGGRVVARPLASRR